MPHTYIAILGRRFGWEFLVLQRYIAPQIQAGIVIVNKRDLDSTPDAHQTFFAHTGTSKFSVFEHLTAATIITVNATGVVL